MASRKSSHKMKSAITDERKKKLLRVHRRSLDQREMRQDQVNKRRQIDDMSPVVESQEASKNPSKAGTPVSQTAAVCRREMLKKWKEERELRRKLEAMEKGRSKPGFRVKHVEYHETDLYNKMKKATETAQASGQANKQTAAVKPAPPRPKASKSSKETVVPAAAKPTTTKSNVKPTTRASSTTTAAGKRTAGATTQPEKKPAVPPATRTTRSRGTAAMKTTSPKKAKPSPAKRKAKPNFMAPTAASQTRAIAGSKKEAAPPATTTHKRRGGLPPRAAAVKDTGNVSTRRGDAGSPTQPSFAPNDFVFEAPNTVQSFVFKPLSPASSASFLFPQASANSTTMVTFTEKVGRTSTPKGDRLPPSSSEDDTSDETLNNAVVPEHSDKSSARRSRSLARHSHTMPADGSPILESKTAANKTPITVGESGIVADAGTDTASEKTATQDSSADTATSAEEEAAVPTEPKSSPVKSRKGRKSRQSVSGKRKAEEPETETENAGETEQPAVEGSPVKSRKGRKSRQSVSGKRKAEEPETEMENAGETEQPAVEGNEESAPSQPRKGKRKSKRVSIQAELAEDPEEAPAAKQRRKSRKSTASSKLEVVSESDNVAEPAPAQPAVSEEMAEEQKTPRKSSRSRRSTAAKSQDLVQEADTEEKTDQQEQKNTASRRSRRSNLPEAGDSVASKPAEEEDKETAVEDKEKEAEIGTPKRARRSRRSVAIQQEDSVENQDVLPMEKKSANGTKSVTLVEPAAAEGVPEPTTPESRRPNLRGRTTKDDLFLTPGPPVSTQKRSTAKRRRTATMIALSTAKSPEEAIKIIATSPMIELTRRTPKTKMSPEMRNQSASLTFDENDFALAPVQLSSAFEVMSRDTDATSDDQTSSTEPQPTFEAPSAAGSAEVQEVACSDGEKEKRDVSTFRERLAAEIKKLTQLSHHWTEIETNTDLPDEAQGQVRTTVCQAQLLMDSHKKSKFNRFAGLVDKCEAGDPSTTCQDLEGFWDLIYIEVINIYKEFDQLERLQQNQWQADVPAVQTASSSSQPAKKTKKAAPSGSKKQKPAGKSKFAAFKAQLMKQREAQEENTSTGDVPAEEKVFDAGFFKVNSPVRTPGYHCEAGTPSKSNSPSSKSKGHSSTPTSSKMSAPTTSTAPTSSPKTAADNKENVAQVFLRRSVGGTPGRRSYVPSVPSPLLKDGGSAARSAPLSPSKAINGANSASEGSGADLQEKAAPLTPVRPRKSLTGRRSTRGRKSVSFLEKSQGEDENVDMTAFLQPFNSQSNSPIQEEVAAVMENSPFSVVDMLKQQGGDTSASATPALPLSSGRRGKNCLKSLPSSERRRSRRSVSFATSTNTSEGTIALPSTPYNINSLVPGRRVTRRSMASPSHAEQSPLGELKKLRATPPPRRSARPSLLYTPPKAEAQPRTGAKNVPVATLVSFSP